MLWERGDGGGRRWRWRPTATFQHASGGITVGELRGAERVRRAGEIVREEERGAGWVVRAGREKNRENEGN